MDSLSAVSKSKQKKKTTEIEYKRRQTITSKLLSDILDTHGSNKFVSEIKQRDQRLEEFTETFLTKTKNIASGGYAEGTVIKESDSDVMGIIQRVLVVEPNENAADVLAELVMVTNGCSPGYVKLKIRKLDRSMEIPSTDSYSLKFRANLDYVTLKYRNEFYISSDKFKEKVNVSGCVKPDNFTDTGISVSGPAMKNKTLLTEVDYVVSFECRSWPKPARDWLIRPRLYNWPSKELLQRLSSECQCYVVPTGDESSECSGMQWRMSFVSIERELVWHMNDAQLKCFIILKILLKSIEERLPKNTLKTYHLKNTMFWMLENTPAEKWSKNMLIVMVDECIQKLIKYVKKRELPQYMLPENNLFKNRFLNIDDVQNTITCFENVSGNVLQTVRASFAYRHMTAEVLKNKESLYNGMLVRSNNDFGNFIIYISRFESSSKIQEFSEVFLNQFPDEAPQFIPSINIAIARTMYIEQLQRNRDENISRQAINRYLHKALEEDPLRSSLYCALFDFKEKKYEKVMEGVERNLFYVILSKKQNLQDVCLSCIDNYYVPHVIILEQVLKGGRWFVKIHQLVLGYLLIFLSEHLLGHEEKCSYAIDMLSSVVACSKEHYLYFVHLNCLGYCYALQGDNASAFKIFCESLQKFPSVVNAAAYHIAFMVNKTNLACC